jgi:hypothetical protein
MTWIKLDDGFPQNPKIVGLGDHSFRLYISALCYSGKYLTDGFIPQAIINQLGDATELVQMGLWEETLGGIQVINYIEYQTPKAEVEKKREANRNRVTRYREKSNALVMHPDNRIQNTDNINNYMNEFEQFWSSYPLKVGKGAAIKAWLKAVKRATPQIIIEGACRYASDPNRDAAFTAHASTWLNSDRWGDSPLPPKSLRNSPQRLDNTPTIVPPRFTADDLPQGVPMPENIRDLLRAHK